MTVLRSMALVFCSSFLQGRTGCCFGDSGAVETSLSASTSLACEVRGDSLKLRSSCSSLNLPGVYDSSTRSKRSDSDLHWRSWRHISVKLRPSFKSTKVDFTTTVCEFAACIFACLFPARELEPTLE
eukprot:CAMPEP_0181453578 /NCGR_PEP_ID=MMETSP1110-20121109/29798_1 /TAXON_ID=174948 /ORGANISM="Symbiodinium sp., Strain CCMP421" /LENGTH=126 /DNA_ID=CAMNT_0023577903 /DNA_START=640 /DNA_END=1017 /DNA_ORIENTATION=+